MNYAKPKKLIYIFFSRHYYKYDDDMFGFDEIRKKRIEVEVWSLVNWKYGREIEVPQNVHSGELVYLNSEQQFLEKLKSLSDTKDIHFILYAYHSYDKVTFDVVKTIKKMGYSFSNLTESADLVEVKIHSNDCYYIIKGIVNIAKMFVSLLLCTCKSLRTQYKCAIELYVYGFWGPIIYKSDYNFIRCKNAYNYIPNPFEVFSKRNVLINHTDYDYHLKNKNNLDEEPTNIAVFIDEYEVGHSDWIKAGKDFPIKNKELYYAELNSFFNEVEKEFGLEVIIAAHPKAEYDGSEFGGRKIKYFETQKLVEQSKLVIYIYGTSLTSILINRKNLIHICTSQHMKGHTVDAYIKKVDEMLGIEVLDISKVNSKLSNHVCSISDKAKKLVEWYVYANKNELVSTIITRTIFGI